MFEKEADEYATENWEYYEEGKNDSKELEQAYLAGAEFGYNKAFVEADKNLKAIVTDFNKAKELEKEKCELLGIIQAKDELIKKMKCCENCRHYSRTYGHCYSYDSYQNCESLSNWSLSDC